MHQALHFVYYLGWFYYYSQPLGFAGWFLHITDKFFLLIFSWHHLMILFFVLHFTPFVGRCIRHRFDYGAIILLGNCFELFVHVVPSIYLRSSCFLKFVLICISSICKSHFVLFNRDAQIPCQWDYNAAFYWQADERFQEERNRAHISKWLRKSIKQYDSFDASLEGLKSFFRDVKVPSFTISFSSITRLFFSLYG